jgi:hypothetical protein
MQKTQALFIGEQKKWGAGTGDRTVYASQVVGVGNAVVLQDDALLYLLGVLGDGAAPPSGGDGQGCQGSRGERRRSQGRSGCRRSGGFGSEREEQTFGLGIVGANRLETGNNTPINPSTALHLDHPEQIAALHHIIHLQV